MQKWNFVEQGAVYMTLLVRWETLQGNVAFTAHAAIKLQLGKTWETRTRCVYQHVGYIQMIQVGVSLDFFIFLKVTRLNSARFFSNFFLSIFVCGKQEMRACAQTG